MAINVAAAYEVRRLADIIAARAAEIHLAAIAAPIPAGRRPYLSAAVAAVDQARSGVVRGIAAWLGAATFGKDEARAQLGKLRRALEILNRELRELAPPPRAATPGAVDPRGKIIEPARQAVAAFNRTVEAIDLPAAPGLRFPVLAANDRTPADVLGILRGEIVARLDWRGRGGGERLIPLDVADEIEVAARSQKWAMVAELAGAAIPLWCRRCGMIHHEGDWTMPEESLDEEIYWSCEETWCPEGHRTLIED